MFKRESLRNPLVEGHLSHGDEVFLVIKPLTLLILTSQRPNFQEKSGGKGPVRNQGKFSFPVIINYSKIINISIISVFISFSKTTVISTNYKITILLFHPPKTGSAYAFAFTIVKSVNSPIYKQ